MTRVIFITLGRINVALLFRFSSFSCCNFDIHDDSNLFKLWHYRYLNYFRSSLTLSLDSFSLFDSGFRLIWVDLRFPLHLTITPFCPALFFIWIVCLICSIYLLDPASWIFLRSTHSLIFRTDFCRLHYLASEEYCFLLLSATWSGWRYFLVGWDDSRGGGQLTYDVLCAALYPYRFPLDSD